MPGSNQDDRRAASDAVHGAQQLFAMYPMASASRASTISNNLTAGNLSGRPSSYMQPEYYGASSPPPYSEVDYANYSNQTMRLLHQQQQAQPHMQPQLFPTWSPSIDHPSSIQPSRYAQTVMQQSIPASSYPTPPPQSTPGPIINSPATSSLAYALGQPPQQFLNNFVSDRAAQLQTTPKKRKSQTDLESPSKRFAPSTPTSVATPTASTSTSVPTTPSTRGDGSVSRKRTVMAYVDVPPKPWATPKSSIPSTPMSSRRTGDRDERTAAEKFSALLEDAFEAEDSLPGDPTEDELPPEYFVPGPPGSLPLPSSSLVRKVTKLICSVARPTKRLNASPRKGGGSSNEIDRDSVARMLKLLERTVRAGQDVEPFPPPAVSSSTSAPPSKKSVSPQKKGKSKSPVKEVPQEQDDYVVDYDTLYTQVSSIQGSIQAAECTLCLLLYSGHPNLLSEELLSACFAAVKGALERVIYPFVEVSSPHATQSDFNASILALSNAPATNHDADKVRKVIGDTFVALSSALPRITSLVNDESLSHSSLSESLIITAVFIAIGPFFVVADSDSHNRSLSKDKGKERESVLSRTLGHSAMRGLRLDALGLIRSIFAHHQEQRSWIIEEVLSNLIKLSESGKQKSGQFRLRDGRQIKTSSALLLQLVQTSSHDVLIAGKKIEKGRQQAFALRRQESFVSLNEEGQSQKSGDGTSDEDTLGEYDRDALRLYASGLESATKAAGTIVVFLTTRSGKSKATKNTNEAEYRNILDSLINDLLVVLFQPEWPAASLVLSVICRFMVSSLDDVKSSNSAVDNNATKSIALDHLGVIAARIRSTILKTQDADAIRPMDEIAKDLDMKAFTKLMDAHHDLSSHLCQKTGEDQAYGSARELTAVSLAQELASSMKQINLWITDAEDVAAGQDLGQDYVHRDLDSLNKFAGKVQKELWDVWKDYTVDVFDVVTPEDTERVEGLAEEIGIVQNLRNSFQPILNTILAALDSQAIFMRTKALKALGQIVTSDPTILSAANVRRSIESHLIDSSPQVRDAAVELIGKYMVEKPEVAGDYYSKIADRIADTGLAVRKRVIKLLKSFYTVTSDNARKIDISTRLVLRLRDEDDTVKDLAIKTLEELWFPPALPPSALKSRSSNRASSPDRAALQNKAIVIMGVSGHFTDRQSLLEDMLHKIIATKEGNEAKTLHQRYTEICEVLIDGLVDATELPGFTLIGCVRTTYLFTSAYPQVLSSSNASTLLPYLRSATNQEEFITSDYLLKAFRAAIPHMPKTASQFGKDLQSKLQPMITKPSSVGGLLALQETVACICSVVEHLTRDFAPLVGLLKSCNGRLQAVMKQHPDGGIKDPTAKAVTMLIFILALLGEHCNFERAVESSPSIAKDLAAISDVPLVEHIYSSLLVLYNKNNDPVLRGRILQCLGFLFRAHPTLMTLEDSARIMDSVFSSSDYEARGRLLKIIQDFLISESVKHSEKQKASAKMKQATDINMDELVGNTEGFAESGVSSAVVQRYLVHILEAALSTHPVTQASALDILTFTIKQGLAHPLQSFPVLVSLETSTASSLSNRAAALHQLLHSKHATILNTRYTVSARESFKYQKRLAGNDGVVSGYRIQSLIPVALLQRWYSLVREKRASRQEFLKALVKVFQENPGAQTSQDDVDFTRYMAENFSALEYKTQEEVLTVIKFLTSVLSTTGMQVLDMISPQNLFAQLHAPLESENVMLVDGAPAQTDGQIDKIPLMRTSVVIGMVMLLKAYLKNLYSLSEEKCSKFELNKKSAIGDKPAVRRHQKPITWERLPFATKPILTSADVTEQKLRFLDVWNEDGVSAEPEDEMIP